MVQKLKFFIKNSFIKDDFVQAKKHVPEWYKEIRNPIQEPDKFFKKNIKYCTPFLDAITAGYSFELSQDIKVGLINESVPALRWNIEEKDIVTVGERTEPSGLPKIQGYHAHEFIWKIPVSFQTPKGYSLFLTHPINRYDLPFVTLGGFIDADKVIQNGNIPFLLKEGFEGVIEAGTPIFQVIPIKREIWEKEFSPELEELANKNSFLSERYLFGWYKKNIWQRKEYR